MAHIHMSSKNRNSNILQRAFFSNAIYGVLLIIQFNRETSDTAVRTIIDMEMDLLIIPFMFWKKL